MSNNTVKDLFSSLPNEYASTNNANLNRVQYVDSLLKSTVPNKDLVINEKKRLLLSYRRRLTKSKQQHKRKKELSRKEKQELGLLKCPKTGWNYNELEPLRQLWRQYYRDHLELTKYETIPTPCDKNWESFSLQIARADYHGAELKIIRSKCMNLVGLTGTCVLDRKNTFALLGRDNKCRTIPKVDSVFQIKLEEIELTIFGKYLQKRTAERVTLKIKSQLIPDL